jgi:hypothetical protein
VRLKSLQGGLRLGRQSALQLSGLSIPRNGHMKGMLVAVVDVVHMVIMLDGFVPAAGPVLVLSRAVRASGLSVCVGKAGGVCQRPGQDGLRGRLSKGRLLSRDRRHGHLAAAREVGTRN